MGKKKITKIHYEITYKYFPKTKFALNKDEAERIIKNSPGSWGKATLKRSNLNSLLNRRKR